MSAPDGKSGEVSSKVFRDVSGKGLGFPGKPSTTANDLVGLGSQINLKRIPTPDQFVVPELVKGGKAIW